MEAAAILACSTPANMASYKREKIKIKIRFAAEFEIGLKMYQFAYGAKNSGNCEFQKIDKYKKSRGSKNLENCGKSESLEIWKR